MPDIKKFPAYFRSYEWNDKHTLFGYPADAYGEFEWIASLEKRFAWLRRNHAASRTSSLHLIRELIQWGGSQNGVLQKFDERLGEVHLYEMIAKVIANIQDPKAALEAALEIPGMGLTYASKLLRFLDPENYGALDSRVRGALAEHAESTGVPKIYDGNLNSMVKGYVAFLKYLAHLQKQLAHAAIARPQCNLPAGASAMKWRAADIEMALFRWADTISSRPVASAHRL
ncbi:hypothetical protein [Variovorax sp. dw_954]|uniref:hypothetical protein n=1 Tax=Variovorax sp. dw_954 TaxID=2720078 RepID=UPI001BD3D944|nr:hypothetical protein [Variovorax sp. dw_954]